MSADQQAFQVAMSALQEAEEEVVDLHGQYFAHRDKMDKMLIPLYQMTNEVDYDVDGEFGNVFVVLEDFRKECLYLNIIESVL